MTDAIQVEDLVRDILAILPASEFCHDERDDMDDQIVIRTGLKYADDGVTLVPIDEKAMDAHLQMKAAQEEARREAEDDLAANPTDQEIVEHYAPDPEPKPEYRCSVCGNTDAIQVETGD